MAQKERKTLYLPSWIVEILDIEGEKYDGPGVVVASMIYAFSVKNRKEKIKVLQDYRANEITMAYDDVVVEAILDDISAAKPRAKKKDIQKVRKSSKSG